jgi:hypothetical protein
MAAFINSGVWPQRDSVVKSVRTVLCQIYLNKLFIPDVLIDIIKDYIYISAEEILKKFHRSTLNASIAKLTCSVSYFVDIYGRRRLAHWATGQDWASSEVQLQQVMCITCGESTGYHTNLNGCCALEFDGEDGALELEEITPEQVGVTDGESDEMDHYSVDPHEEDYDRYDEDYDRYNEDNWYAGDRYGARDKDDSDDDRRY